MTDKNNTHNEFDTRLLKLIGLLRPTPPRNPKAVEQGRAKFLAEVDALIGTSGIPSRKKKFYQFQSKEKTNMNAYKPKFALTTLFVIATIFVFLFGGTGLTVYAAQSALPGDALYPVKTGFEQTRLSLTSNDDLAAQMHLSLAQKRLDEIKGLIKEGRFDQVGKTSAEFERQIQQAVEALKRLAEKDSARAGELTAQLMTELSSYTSALTGMLSNLPEDVKVEVEKAIVGSESAGLVEGRSNLIEFTGVITSMAAESWTVSGRQVTITLQTEIKGSFSMGETVKVHAQVSTNGLLTALEIEASTTVGNANDNNNGNVNSIDNTNLNDNNNGNENENVNQNGNENENANSNENENANDNDNGNDNGFADEDKFEFKGTVQTILPDMWVISGVTVAVSSGTNFRGDIAVGDQVEVYAADLPDGTLQALEIKLEDGSSANDNGDDHGSSIGTNDNSNDNGDDHGSDNGSSNDNGGGSGGGSDDNSNDHGGGSNDNGSGSGGSNDNGHGG